MAFTRTKTGITVDFKDLLQIRLARKIRSFVMSFIKAVFIAGFCFIILYPVIIMLSKAFMDKKDLFNSNVVLVPIHFTLDNVVLAGKMMNYGAALKNTVLLTIPCALLQTASCLLTAYGFARFNFPLKKLLFALVLFTIIVPPQLIMVPLFMRFQYFDVFGIYHALTGERGLNLIDNFTPFILLSMGCMSIKNGLFIYIFRQFFKGMPKETEEAAYIDGAGTFRTFWQLMLPNAQTAIITVFLFAIVWQYNDTTFATLFLQNTPILSTAYGTLQHFDWGDLSQIGQTIYTQSNEFLSVIKSTGVLLMLTPLILLYLALQRFFVNSIAQSGLVG